MVTFGMALAGGGARGAYTAGTLRYLYTELPEETRLSTLVKVVPAPVLERSTAILPPLNR